MSLLWQWHYAYSLHWVTDSCGLCGPVHQIQEAGEKAERLFSGSGWLSSACPWMWPGLRGVILQPSQPSYLHLAYVACPVPASAKGLHCIFSVRQNIQQVARLKCIAIISLSHDGCVDQSISLRKEVLHPCNISKLINSWSSTERERCRVRGNLVRSEIKSATKFCSQKIYPIELQTWLTLFTLCLRQVA